MFKCQVLSALSFMLRHYCFMFGLPSSRTYTSARRAEHSRAHVLSRIGARIERLKLIRVYGRRIKPGTECREKIGNLCAGTGTLHSAVIAFAESLFRYSCLAKSRPIVCPSRTIIVSAARARAATFHAKRRLTYLRACIY